MITITSYRAAIGCFYGAMKKCTNKQKSQSINDYCFNDCFFDTYGNYIFLCIIRKYFPTLLSVFDIGVNELSNISDLIKLLLGGDIERNPGPNTEYNEAQPAKLVNGGTNTCFANSTLQLLNSIPAFKTAVSNTNYPTLPDFLLDRSLQSIKITLKRVAHSLYN